MVIALGGRATAGIDHDERLDNVLIGGCAAWLNDEDIPPPDVILYLNAGFSICESIDAGMTQFDVEMSTDSVSQFLVCIARENDHVIIHSIDPCEIRCHGADCAGYVNECE